MPEREAGKQYAGHTHAHTENFDLPNNSPAEYADPIKMTVRATDSTTNNCLSQSMADTFPLTSGKRLSYIVEQGAFHGKARRDGRVRYTTGLRR